MKSTRKPNSKLTEIVQKFAGYVLLLTVMLTSAALAQTADPPPNFGTSDGSSGDPYEIATLNNLYWLSQTSSEWDKHYIQTADIDASSSATWDDGDGGDPEGFSPIGNNTNAFEGSYNGQGHIISGLTIDRSSGNLGLFGRTDLGTTIQNLGLVDVDITGGVNAGGLAGNSGSTISNIYTTGSVKDADIFSGGLVGSNTSGGTLNNSFSLVTVNGVGVGGLAGSNSSGASITNSYSAGSVSGTSVNVGGLVGSNNGTITNSYWDTDASGQATSEGGTTGLSTTEMRRQSNFNTWDFTNTWTIGEGFTYPYLQNNIPSPLPGLVYEGGTGTPGDPYQVGTLEQLDAVRFNPDKHFIQTADIDASDAQTWDSGNGFTPIGDDNTQFTGTYDGDDHTITGLYIDRGGTNYVGLFGYISGSSVELTNIGLKEVDITGNNHVSGLAGRNFDGATISNSYTKGSVTGNGRYVGGLVGSNHGSNIINSYSTADLDGSDEYLGGLAGINETFSSSGGAITGSYATGNVSGDLGHVGGLVGRNYNGASITQSFATGAVNGGSNHVGGLVGSSHGGTISLSYATGTVTSASASNVGGLVGINEPLTGSGGTITDSYAAGLATGNSNFGGLTGVNTGTVTGSYWDSDTGGPDNGTGTKLTGAQMRRQANFTGWDFFGIWDIEEEQSYPYLQNNIPSPFPGYIPFIQGDGSPGNPYQLSTLPQLDSVRNYLDKHFIQTADIDASDTENWNDGAGFVPIGDNSTPFTGGYNGDGHTITGLTIDRGDTDIMGLFGIVSGATIENLGIVNADITGRDGTGGLAASITNSSVITECYVSGTITGTRFFVGGLAGAASGNSSIDKSYSTATVTGSNQYIGGLIGSNNSSTISSSYSTGSVSGGNSQIGGLVGINDGTGAIQSSYSAGDVTGNFSIGGLAGENLGTIEDSYSIGNINGNGNIGGLVGNNAGAISRTYSSGTVTGDTQSGLIGSNLIGSGTVEDSFWNTETSGQSGSVEGTGLTSAEMRQQASLSGFDFSNTWAIDELRSFPFLQSNVPSSLPGFITFLSGDGTSGDPYHILTLAELDSVRNYLDKHFIQMSDIDASETQNWDGGAGFTPIGDSGTPFSGSYDGNGHTISELTINRSGNTDTGLFGAAGGADIQNLRLTSVNITGGNNTGGLVGHNDNTTTSNIFITGDINGGNNTGGLTGQNLNSSSVSSSYSTAGINGSDHTGGLIGQNDNATVNNSYSTGSVNGGDIVGGLVGENLTGSTITNSYSSGSVSGNSNTGGLAGGNNGTVTNSYWITDTGGPDNGIGTGLSTMQMRQQNSFSGWDFGSIWSIGEGYTYPYLQNNTQSPPPGFAFAGGEGTSGNPFQVNTLEQLDAIRYNRHKHFI